MAQATVILGAPSLTGKDCVETVTASFAESEFPLTATVENFMPQGFFESFGGGIFLAHVGAKDKHTAQCVFKSLDEVKKMAEMVSQIATLHGYEKAISITADGLSQDAVVGTATVGSAKVSSSSRSRTTTAKTGSTSSTSKEE